jgi:hypothetical protein
MSCSAANLAAASDSLSCGVMMLCTVKPRHASQNTQRGTKGYDNKLYCKFEKDRVSTPEDLRAGASRLIGSYRMQRLRHQNAMLEENSRQLRRPTGDIQLPQHQQDGGIAHRQQCAY